MKKNPYLNPDRDPDIQKFENSLRPKTLDEFIGQEKIKNNLKVFIESCKIRKVVLDHILFSGPPGLGKTTLANIIANELGSKIHVSSGPAIERKGDLAGILSNLAEGDVLFIDEIHRLNPVVEENLYPAMEDFRFDFVIGEGPHAKSIKLPLKHFTLIGATTRTGLLTGPLRDRFGMEFRLEFYTPEELLLIVKRASKILNFPIDDDAALEIAKRSRGTPRIANRLFRRVLDFAVVKKMKKIDKAVTEFALVQLDIDRMGLSFFDRKYLKTIIEKFSGGPVGIDTIAAALNEDRGTIEDVVEPYLIKEGFIKRTPRGRVATAFCYRYFKLKSVSGDEQNSLF